jgi:mitofusin
LTNDAKEVLETLRKCVEERRLIAFPTADNTKDTRPSGLSNDQLNVLKTYPTLGPDGDYITVTDEIQNTILTRNINSAQEHIEKMKDRAKSDYYHILVAGDINSGKSAFINGLFRQEILPSGPVSLTSTFVEILDAQDIDGREEAHLCKKGMDYDCRNAYTFKRENIEDLYDIMYDWNRKHYNTTYDTIKVYVNHCHTYVNFFSNSKHKAHIIDSVGLNTDTNDTLALFKKTKRN